MNKGNILQSSTWSNSMNSNQTPSSSSSMAMSLWHDSCQEVLPESWSQLLLGGSMSEVERCGLMSTPNYQSRKMESWEDQMVVYHPSASADRSNNEVNEEGGLESRSYYFGGEEIQLAARASWAHQINNLPASSPRSCVTTSFGSGMLDFSNNKAEKRHLSQPLDQHECNSTERGAASKKTRVQVSCSAQSPFKVRKEKLGDRITSLHQLVSPFGKTDTASVLLEAIGYIRFLQNQIEALSSPYLVSGGSDNTKQPGAQGRSCIFPEDPGQLLDDNFTKKRGSPDQIVSNEPKDLRSRGLCLVPLSCTLHVGSDNGADYWAASFGTGFR